MRILMGVLLLLCATLQLSANSELSRPLLRHLAAPRKAIDLGGEWEFLVQKADAPIMANSIWTKTTLPESRFTDSGYSTWYRRNVTLPVEFAEKRLRLFFEQVSDGCEVYVNGRKVHENATVLPFEADVTGFLQPGENEVLLKLTNIFNNTEVRPTTPAWALKNMHGAFAPIHLEVSDPVRIKDLRVETQVAPQKVWSAGVVLRNDSTTTRRVTLTAAIAGEWSITAAPVDIPAGEEMTVPLRHEWPEVTLWSPATPKLYYLDLSLAENDKIIDAYRQRFGFREIKIEGSRITLNGFPFILRRDSTMEDGYKNQHDMQEVMLLRISRGVIGMRQEFSQLYRRADLADEVGQLLVTIPPSNGAASQKTPEYWHNMEEFLTRATRIFRHHPSIIGWGISCEFGSVYGADGKEADVVPKQLRLVKAILTEDPTRPWSAYGEIELGIPSRGPGAAPIRSLHYPVSPNGYGEGLPEIAYWLPNGRSSWQGKATPGKPVSISEDFYHGMTDQYFGMTRWGGDAIYTSDGYYKAWFDAIRMFAEGYYYAGISAWNPWYCYTRVKDNPLFRHGQPMPDFLIALREAFPNLQSGGEEKRRVFVYNQMFDAYDCELIRVDIFRGKPFRRDSQRLTLTAGMKFETEMTLKAPLVEQPEAYTVKYILRTDSKILIERSFDFLVFPRIRPDIPENCALLAGSDSVLAGFRFDKGRFENAEEAVGASPGLLIVDAILSMQDGVTLNRFVENGGRILFIEASESSWTPLTLQFRRNHSFVWRRSDSCLPKVTENMLRAWRPDTILSHSSYSKDGKTDMSVILDVGGPKGVDEALLLRLYRGRGAWLLCQLPVLSRLEVEPSAGFMFQQILAEAAKPIPVKMRKLTLVPGENNYRELFERESFVFAKTIEQEDILWVDGSHPISLEEQKRLLAHAQNGGIVFLAEVTDRNSAFLEQLGLSLVPSDAEWIHRIGNEGLLEGLSNDYLFYSSVPMSDYFRWEMLKRWKPKMEHPLLTGALTLREGSRARITTSPGALATVPVGKGTITVSTLRFTRSIESYPEKTVFALRTLLLNSGALTAPPPSDFDQREIPLRNHCNRGLWDDPKYSNTTAWFGNGNDMRYFPVNLCGWSPLANAPCPVATFPSEMLNFGGVKFRVVNPASNRGNACLVIAPRESVTIPIDSPANGFWFLGAMESTLPTGTPVLEFHAGNGGTEMQLFNAGEHLNIYRWNGACFKGRIAWSGYTQKDPNGALYCWYQRHPEEKEQFYSFITLKNISSVNVAMVAITARENKENPQ